MSGASKEEIKAIVAGLRKSALLSGLNDRDLKRLAQIALVRQIAKDSVIVTRGEKGIGFYVVLSGRVQVRKGGKVVAHLGPGDFFGELALFENRPRSADVVAVESTRVVVLSRWEFWGFASERSDLLRIIIQEMARRIAQTEAI
ncbi:MAG: cyclic nucleotide-binding domain-containing protein [Thermoplasmata archaeon]